MHKLLKQAFTLIELLVVIAIIGILSGLIVVAMGGMTQKASIAKAKIFSNSLRNSLMMNIAGEWKLDETSGTIANDTWGGNNNGALTGFTDTTAGYGDSSTNTSGWMSSYNCVSGTCLKFSDSSITCANSPSLKITTTITISAWVKTTSASGNQMILEKSPAGSNGYNLLSTNGKLEGRIYPSSIASTATISDGVWHHVAMSNQNIINGWSLYVDGVNVLQQNGAAILDNDQPLYIGRRGGNSLPFYGSIDDVRVYNSAMPTSQIKEQYYAGLNSLLANGNINLKEYSERINSIATK